MSLLNEIRDDVIDESRPLRRALRRCKVLAVKINHQELRAWVDAELSGYKQDDVPEYRRVLAIPFGQFVSRNGAAEMNGPLPVVNLPDEAIQFFREHRFGAGVAELEDLLSALPDGRGITNPVPPELVHTIRNMFFENFVLVSAHKEIPRASLVGVLEAIRDRLLNFVLALETAFPNADEIEFGDPMTRKKVDNAYQINIHGGTNQIAAGNESVVQTQHAPGDIAALGAALKAEGLSETQVHEILTLVKAEPAAQKGLGPKLSSYFGEMARTAAAGTGTLLVEKLPRIIELVSVYFGLK